MMILVCLLVVIAVVATGCARAVSRQAMKHVDKGVTFEQLLDQPDRYTGTTVLLGGVIIETENHPGNTLILVLERPLDYQKKPVSRDVSKGRFIVRAPGFLDPAIYRPRRKVTVVGTVVGKETRALDEVSYTYPVISREELHIWPAEEEPVLQSPVQFGVGIGIGIGL
jgi:outer membrane lipoprotein